MALSRLRHNPREGENVHRARPGAQEHARSGVGGGARGEHVVDEERAPALEARLRSGGTRKAPWRLSARCARVRPTCGRVGLTRARRNGSTGTPLAFETILASATA